MADKRMICTSVVSSDSFLDLSFEAQALYIQLTMAADNFGFVSGVKRILRGMGASDTALEALKDGHFIITFDSGIIVMAQWFVANWGGDFAKNDRRLTTTFLDELSRLDVDSMGGYVLKNNDHPIHSVGSPHSIQYKVIAYIQGLLSQIDHEKEYYF